MADLEKVNILSNVIYKDIKLTDSYVNYQGICLATAQGIGSNFEAFFSYILNMSLSHDVATPLCVHQASAAGIDHDFIHNNVIHLADLG